MSRASAAGSVVAWLVATGPSANSLTRPLASSRNFVLAQKNKQFSPHLLVVPVGSDVEFPNFDPFFHNVFSLYNGRRFDLGLYEAGNHRSVRFDHEGVSYIFCNIHPEMGAVVVSLSTPFYAQSDKDGAISLLNVPSGDYDLHLWSENVSTADLSAATEKIHVSSQKLDLPSIILPESASPLDEHLNKFGEAYKKADQTPY